MAAVWMETTVGTVKDYKRQEGSYWRLFKLMLQIQEVKVIMKQNFLHAKG